MWISLLYIMWVFLSLENEKLLCNNSPTPWGGNENGHPKF